MGQFSIVRQNPTDLDECAHDEHRNLNRSSLVEHTRGHDRPVLGECVGKGLGELQARQVVAVCDHLRLRSVLNLDSEARRDASAACASGPLRRTSCRARRLHALAGWLSADQCVVFVVGPDPEPHDVAPRLNRQGSIVQSDADRPELADSLELQRSMRCAALEQRVASIGQLPDFLRQCAVATPETRRGAVFHRSRVRAAW
jgi:hypothetical protein